MRRASVSQRSGYMIEQFWFNAVLLIRNKLLRKCNVFRLWPGYSLVRQLCADPSEFVTQPLVIALANQNLRVPISAMKRNPIPNLVILLIAVVMRFEFFVVENPLIDFFLVGQFEEISPFEHTSASE